MESDGLPLARRRWSMTTVALVTAMAVLDGVIANVALPSIARALDVSPAASIWVINAYNIAIVATLLPLASLGEILGYRRVYQAGVLLFTLASLACALSHSLPMLIAARVVQGLGAAGIMSMNSAMIRFSYPRAMLGRAVGFTAIVVALASAAGPSIAAAILSVADWPWLFAVNVPLGVAALIVGQFALPRIAPAPRRFDALAAVLNALTFGALFMGVEGITEGTRPVLSAFETAAGLAAGAALVLRSLGQPRPLAPVDLLRIPLFAMAMATSVASFLAQNFAFVALPFLMEYAFHRTPVETGLLMTPWSLAVAAVAPISGRLADRYPGGIIAAAGLALLGAGLVALALLPAAPSAFDIGWRMVIGGVGFALFQSPNNRQLLSSAPTERAGSAGGMLATARLTGQTVGAVLVALVFRAAVGPPSPKILLIAAASAFVAAVLSWLKPDRG